MLHILYLRPKETHNDARSQSSDATFADLKSIAAWFGTRTPSETIDRIVREAMEQLGMERDEEAEGTLTTTSSGIMEFKSAPGLAFTKPISASVHGKAIHSPRWAGILLTTIAQVKAQGVEGDTLVRELHIPAKAQRYEEEGFKVLPRPWYFGAGPVRIRGMEGS